MNEDPNERQIGGEHYRKANPAYQHWDLVAEFNMNYYTACATKYVARWREKEGLKDLGKAVHYIDKLISLYAAGIGLYTWAYRNQMELAAPSDRLYRWCDEQQLTRLETLIMEMAVNYHDQDDLLRLRGYIVQLYDVASASLATGAAGPAHSTAPLRMATPAGGPRTNAISEPAAQPKRGLT